MQSIELDTSVGYLLKQASSALHAAMEAVLRPLGLTVTRYSCLEVLRHRPEISGAELARSTFVTRQSMQHVLGTLEADGLVARAETAQSGRELPVRLTPAGEERLRLASEAVRGVELRMLADLTDVDAFRTALRAATDALSA
jgi:DNA-binding MarR family transcriptional regulator